MPHNLHLHLVLLCSRNKEVVGLREVVLLSQQLETKEKCLCKDLLQRQSLLTYNPKRKLKSQLRNLLLFLMNYKHQNLFLEYGKPIKIFKILRANRRKHKLPGLL